MEKEETKKATFYEVNRRIYGLPYSSLCSTKEKADALVEEIKTYNYVTDVKVRPKDVTLVLGNRGWIIK